MSKNAKEFVASNAYAALAVYPLSSTKSIYLLKDLSFDQPNEYLRMLGWSSGSTLVNNIVLLSILVVLSIFHSLYCLLHNVTKSEENRPSFTSTKVYRFLTFAVYIRAFIEIYMFTTLMIFSEIKYYIKYEDEDGKDNGNPTSLSLSCLLLIFVLFLSVLVFISWRKAKGKMKIRNSWKTKELYQGILGVPKKSLGSNENRENDETGKEINQRMDIYRHEIDDNEVEKEDEDDEDQEDDDEQDVPKNVKLARLYHFIFLCRRLIITLLVVLLPSSVFALKVILLLLLQIAYLAYIISIKSFTETKDRIVEVFSEFIFLVLIFFVIIYRSESKWTSSAEKEFIGIILSLVIIVFLISLASLAFELLKRVRNARKARKARKAKNAKKRKQEAIEKQGDGEVKNKATPYAEASFSYQDQFSQQLPSIPQGSNVFVVKTEPDKNKYDEDRKESMQSEDQINL